MQVYAVCKADEHVPIEQVGTVEGMHGKLAGGTNVEGAVAVLQDRAQLQPPASEACAGTELRWLPCVLALKAIVNENQTFPRRCFCSFVLFKFFFGHQPLEASINFGNKERWGLGAHPLLLSPECKSRKVLLEFVLENGKDVVVIIN